MSPADFIETPSQNLSQDELKAGVKEPLTMLEGFGVQIPIIVIANAQLKEVFLIKASIA